VAAVNNMRLRVICGIFALLCLAASCAPREYVVEATETVYRFDSTLPLSRIVIAEGSPNEQAVNPSPRLTSADYLALAQRMIPTGDAWWTGSFLVSVDALGTTCADPTHLESMSFGWSLPISANPARRERLRVIVNARVGEINRRHEKIEDAYRDMAPWGIIDPMRAEAVMAAAQTAFAQHAERDEVLNQLDCIVLAYTNDVPPLEWEVDFGSAAARRTISFVVNATTLEVRPK